MANKQSFTGFFKDGTRIFEGTDEVILRNVDAAIDLSELTRTSLGPNGMKKIIQNHFGKLFVTGDAATILQEAEIQHPAAKMLVNATLMQGEQVGDGTNLVLVFAGALLRGAAELIRAGISTKDIVVGYQEALDKMLEILPTLVEKTVDLQQRETLIPALRTVLSSHQYLDADNLADLVATACTSVYGDGHLGFNVDNIRVAKCLGGAVSDTFVFDGFALQREVAGTIRKQTDCKVAVFATSFDLPQSDTKMTNVFTSGQQMENYNLSEEVRMEELVKSIKETGVNVVVCQSKITELGLHYLEKYGIMAIQLPSNWDIKRVARAINALPLLRIGAPRPEEIGTSPEVEVKEIGSTPLVMFRASDKQVATIVVRGSTPNIIDDVERSIEDAVNAFLVMTKYPELVAGGGASEQELSVQIGKWASTLPGMDQYGAAKFGEALEIVPRTIAENSGLRIAEFMAKIRAAHNKGGRAVGVDVEAIDIADMAEKGILDVVHVKENAIKMAVESVVTLLRIDQICMSKPARGPAPRTPQARDED